MIFSIVKGLWAKMVPASKIARMKNKAFFMIVYRVNYINSNIRICAVKILRNITNG